jgi:hypothetical protein
MKRFMSFEQVLDKKLDRNPHLQQAMTSRKRVLLRSLTKKIEKKKSIQ